MIGHQKGLNLIKCFIVISNQAILASGLGLGLQINLQLCGFYEDLLKPFLYWRVLNWVTFRTTFFLIWGKRKLQFFSGNWSDLEIAELSTLSNETEKSKVRLNFYSEKKQNPPRTIMRKMTNFLKIILVTKCGIYKSIRTKRRRKKSFEMKPRKH